MPTWQEETLAALRDAAPPGSTLHPYGSFTDALDAWSDLDLDVSAPTEWALDEVGGSPLWAWQTGGSSPQVIRLVTEDGRRIDIRATAARIRTPSPSPDAAVRFDAALASARLGRGDLLIGTHLAIGIARECLELGMRLRDRDTGTTAHRHGTERYVEAVALLGVIAGLPGPEERPNPIERLVARYGSIRTELEPRYRPDWSGLAAVIDRGSGIR